MANNFPWDPYHPARVIIDPEHYQIHEGKVFYITRYVSSVSNGASSDILMAVPASLYPHLRAYIVTANDAPMRVFLYEGATTSDDGTGMTGYNLNRNSANTASTVVTHSPTVTGTGTLLDISLIPDTGGGLFSPGGGAGSSDLPTEWILKPSTKYLIRVTNDSGSATAVDFQIFWYEV